MTKATVAIGSRTIGDPLTHTFGSLEENTSYYIAIAGLNAAGYRSPAAVTSGTTQEDLPPMPTDYPEDVYFPTLGAQKTLDMSEYFTDDLDTDLIYEITAEPASAIKIEKQEGSKYTFTAMEYGNAKVKIKVSDMAGKFTTDEFLTMCRDDSRPMDLYPNPVKDYMYIRLGNNVRGKADVVIYNSSGIKVLSKNNVDISTFEPGKVDVTALYAGNYTVVVTFNNKETKGSITKL